MAPGSSHAMKVIRVPWIVCRADEFGPVQVPVSWHGYDLEIMAYSEKEALDWWGDLSDGERKRFASGSGAGEQESLLF